MRAMENHFWCLYKRLTTSTLLDSIQIYTVPKYFVFPSILAVLVVCLSNNLVSFPRQSEMDMVEGSHLMETLPFQ